MSMETFGKAVDFALKSGVRIVCVSGGEPSLNPNYAEMLRTCAEKFMISTFITNGEWLGTEKEDVVLDILKKHTNLKVQITSIKGLYRLHEETVKKVDAFKQRLKDAKLKHALTFDRDKLFMVALGRATEHEDIMKQTLEHMNSMSCFASALVSAQLPFKAAIDTLEMKGKFCHPLVDWKGNIHWSESVLCPHFANLDEDIEVIWKKANEWRPCCKCADVKKLLANTDPKYIGARILLGIHA